MRKKIKAMSEMDSSSTNNNEIAVAEGNKIKLRDYNLKTDLLLVSLLTSLTFVMSVVVYQVVNIKPSAAAVFCDLLLYFTIYFLVCAIIRNSIAKRCLLSLIFIITSAFFVVDGTFATYYMTPMSLLSTTGAKHMRTGGNIGFDLMTVSILCIIFAALGVTAIWLVRVRKKNRKPGKKSFAPLYIFLALAVVFTSYNVIIMRNTFRSKERSEGTFAYYTSDAYLYDTVYDPNLFIEKFGYANYRLSDIGFSARKLFGLNSKKNSSYNDVKEFYDNQPKKEENALTGVLEGYNVITIMAESLDTRIIHPELTPNLYKLLQNEIAIENHYVPVFQLGATLNSEFMSQTGMLPITENGFRADMSIFYSNNWFGDFSLAGQLGKIGYKTHYFHNNGSVMYDRINLVPNYGFENALFLEDMIEENILHENLRFDRNLLSFFDDPSFDFSEKFYAHFVTMSGHNGEEELYKHNLPLVREHFPNLNEKIANYFAKIHETDYFVGLLMQRLEDEGVRDNTVVMLVQDHYNYDERKLYDFLEVDFFDQTQLHKQTMFMCVGGEKKAAVEECIGDKKLFSTTIDLPPTILNLVAPIKQLQGGGDEANVNDIFDFRYFAGSDIFDEKGIALFANLTMTDGKNWIRIDGSFFGDEQDKEQFREKYVGMLKRYELQKAIFKFNYFEKLANEV